MALDELSRHELHTRLRDAIGEHAAATLMEYLPPVGWADVATKRDLDALGVLLKRDLDAHKALTSQQFDAHTAAMTQAFDAHKAEITHAFDAHTAATKRDLDNLEQRLRADFERGINAATTSQTRTLLLTVIGSNLTIAGIAFAAAALR